MSIEHVERGKDSEYDFTSLQCCISQNYHMAMAVNTEMTNKHWIYYCYTEDGNKIRDLLQQL